MRELYSIDGVIKREIRVEDMKELFENGIAKEDGRYAVFPFGLYRANEEVYELFSFAQPGGW